MPADYLIAGVRCRVGTDFGGFVSTAVGLRAFGVRPDSEPALWLRFRACAGGEFPPDLPPGTHHLQSADGACTFLRPAGSLCTRDRFATSHAWLDAPAALEPFTGQPWLMLALWGYLAHRNGLFLHGGFCEWAGRFFLLLGPQQAGKSTLSRLVAAAGGAAVTDENPFVTREHSGFLGHGSPWTGLHGRPSALSSPLAAIFFLRHAPANTLTALAPSQAAERLLHNNRFFTWSAATVPRALELIDELSREVPVFDYGFVPDGSAVEALAEVL